VQGHHFRELSKAWKNKWFTELIENDDDDMRTLRD